MRGKDGEEARGRPGVMNEIELLRGVSPREDDQAAAEDLARDRLQAAMAAERDRRRQGVLVRVRSWWVARRPAVPGLSMGAVAAVGVVLIAVLVTVQVLAPTPATAQLGEMAELAESVEAPTAGDGTWVYSRSTATATFQAVTPAGSILIILDETNERWISADGTHVVRTTISEPRFLDAASEAAFYDSGLAADFATGRQDVQRFARGEHDDDFTTLSATTADVEQFMRGRGGGDDATTDQLLEIARNMLSTAAASPGVRGAVFRVLDQLDDIDVEADEGAGLLTVIHDSETADGAVRRSLVFDAATSVLVADSLVLTATFGDVPAGTVLRDSVHQPPAAVTTPPPAS